MKLEGRAAIVTGAGGLIGGAIARKLAGDGVDVLVADLVPGHLDEVVTDLSPTPPGRHRTDREWARDFGHGSQRENRGHFRRFRGGG